MGIRLAWAVSGRGMLARAIAEAGADRLLATPVCLILTDRSSEIEEFTSERRIETARLHWDEGPDAFQTSIRALLREHRIDWLGMTFNRLLAPDVIADLNGQVLNVHMSLLPAFPGFGAVRMALNSGAARTGATVHLADAGVDTGPIIAQASCPILPEDTEGMLGRRIFEACLPVLLQSVRWIERGALTVDGGAPRWLPRSGPSTMLDPKVDADLVKFAERYCARL